MTRFKLQGSHAMSSVNEGIQELTTNGTRDMSIEEGNS